MLFSVETFFGDIFPDSYVCALVPETKAQTHGYILSQEAEKEGWKGYDAFFEEVYFPLNLRKYGIHFTPNACKLPEKRNQTENIIYINAWYIDIDVEESKHIEDPLEDPYKREKGKEAILEKIFEASLCPSLTNETRNGYQLLWFAKGATVEKFPIIQGGIYNMFKEVGADKATIRINATLRVPYMRFDKDGESGVVLPVDVFSSLKVYSEEEMLAFTSPFVSDDLAVSQQRPFLESLADSPVVFDKWKGGGLKTALDRILETPPQTILEKLSGRAEVRGEVFTFLKNGVSGKLNIFVNGKPTPNWIDTNQNLVFSNNVAGMANVIHYLCYYGFTKGEAISILSKLIG